MSNPKRPSGARAKTPVQPSTKAQAKGNGKSQEQRGPYGTDKKHKYTESTADNTNGSAPTGRRGSARGQNEKSGSQDIPSTPSTSTSDVKAAPRRANSKQKSQKQKDCEKEDKLSHTFESKTEDQPTREKNGRASKPAIISVSEAHATGNNAQRSAKPSKNQTVVPVCDSQDQSDKISTPIRANSNKQNRIQKDHSINDQDDALPNIASQGKRRPKLTKTHNSKSAESTEDELERVLHATIEKLKIKKRERSEASRCVNEITDEVISHLKRNMPWCKDMECLTTGSYYENVKICEPDEFDVMLTVPVERVDIQEFNDNGAFYSIALKRHPNKHPLDKFLNEDKTIRASEMLKEFRDGVKEAVEKCKYEIEVQRKKQKCPAVTLEVTENGNAISIDFVLGLKVHGSWPIYTKDGFKIEKWLGTKEKTDLKRQPYYLVPKYEGKGNVEHEGVVAKDAWRISFSHIEKEILKRHGHSKTCCEAKGQKCCRKECLKLLKYLLSQLKEKDTDKMSKFCSYHAKTTLLHACATKVEDSEWAYSQLADCFQQLLDDFVRYLKNQDLRNFFVPSQNLLLQDYVPKSSCNFLAKQIEIQRNNNFPIFQ